ncbi:hypothetical protein JCM10213_001347 [Rhodosporidiobolus nylandii]
MASKAHASLGERALEARASADEVDGLGDVETGGLDNRLSAGASEGEATPLSLDGLLDLPDETLIHIYELLLASYKLPEYPEDLPKQSRYLLPLDSILVNHRIYNLALQIRQRSFYALGEASEVQDAVQGNTHVHSQATNLDLSRWNCTPGLANLVPSFTSLTSLRVHCHNHLPEAFTTALKSMHHLRSLDLSCDPLLQRLRPFTKDVDDPNFSIERDLPFLRQFTLYCTYPSSRTLLDRGIANIEDFTLIDTFPHTCRIPWTTARRLHLYPPKGYFRDPSVFVEKLAEATEPAAGFAIRDLIIEVQTVSPTKADPDDYYYEQVIPEMLELLQRTSSIKRLEFRKFCDLDSWEGCETRLHTVQELSLQETPAGWRNPDAHQHVPSFLALFPSLTTFHLSGCDVLALPTREAIATAALDPLRPSLPDPLALTRDEPALRALLDVLKKSGVLEFRYRATSDSSVELRFRRETAAADVELEGQWWWL